MKIEQDGAQSVDFVGNDVLWTYDNGIELDGSLRNTRALRNRFTNTYATLSASSRSSAAPRTRSATCS